MGKSDDPKERQIWGTCEELLLACAVARHGARRWDSVASEIRSRSPASHLVTAQSCRQRYVDLQRRFGDAAVKARGDDDGDDGGGGGGGGGGDPDLPSDVPWLEQLRRLRVAELRREVERYDLSIGSLQLKVKRLQEERERSLRTAESSDEKLEEETKEEPLPPSQEIPAGDRISGGASGPSVEQSNSTFQKQKSCEDSRLVAAAGDMAQPSTGGDEKPVEGSYDGSTGSRAASGTARPQAKGESGESIAESKGGEVGGGEKESSDVQSSASLSRRRKKVVFRGRRRGGGDAGEQPETDEASIMSGEAGAESQPLIALLEIFRSDKYGSIFERRLESQETSRYRSLVRQHVDMEMVRIKLDHVISGRSYTSPEFFRDLLLLCTNAVVFYPKSSPEAVAAVHLRRLVSQKMEATCRTSKESAAGDMPPQPKATASKLPDSEPDLACTLAAKPISSVPLKVGRKRSSISSKQTAASAKEESKDEEKNLPKKTAKERLGLSGTTRGLRTNKVRSGSGKGVPLAKSITTDPSQTLKSKPAETLAEPEKPDKKITSGSAAATFSGSAAKKQSATSFLNRMKRNSNGTLIEILKSSPSSGGGGGGGGRAADPKKETKVEGRKDQSTRQGTGGPGKKAAETSNGGPAKRGVGRPPKRGGAAAQVTPASTKRRREEAEAATSARTVGSTTARKRGRR